MVRFCDDVAPLTEAAGDPIVGIPPAEAPCRAETRAPALFGEPGPTTRVRLWAWPTLDVNGLTSTTQGAGTMTLVRVEARARITCRRVANQSAERVFELIAAHSAAHAPAGVTTDVARNRGRDVPFAHGSHATGLAAQVLTEAYGPALYRTRLGGSIPVSTTLLQPLGRHAVMFCFSPDDENLHAPCEFFRLDVFRKGQTAYGRM